MKTMQRYYRYYDIVNDDLTGSTVHAYSTTIRITHANAELYIVQEAGNGLDLMMTCRDPGDVLYGLRDLRVRVGLKCVGQ
jgi:hypothetical protein